MPETQSVEQRQIAFEARFTSLCAEARLSELQARVLRAMLTGQPLHELAKEMYGVLDFRGLSREQRTAALEKAERQATALALAGVQAYRRIEMRFPEAKRDGRAFVRDVVLCARNRGSDWAYAPIGGEQRERMGCEEHTPTKARLITSADLRPDVRDCVNGFLRRETAAAA